MNEKEDIDAKLLITEDMKEDFDKIMNTPIKELIRDLWIEIGLNIEIFDKYIAEYLKNNSVVTIGINSLLGIVACRKKMDEEDKGSD